MSKYSRLEEKITRLEQHINDLRVTNSSRNWVAYTDYQRILHQAKRDVQGEVNTLKEENNTLKQQFEDCTKQISRLGELLLHKTIEISELKAQQAQELDLGAPYVNNRMAYARALQGENNTLKEEKQQMEDRIKRLLHMIEGQADEISKLRARLNPEPPFVTISQMNLNDWRKEVTKLEKIRHILKEESDDDDGNR